MKNNAVNNTNAVRTEQGNVESTQKNGVTQGYAELHDTRLYFERTGEGAPVVFLHAGIADHRMWDTQFHAFADDYDVIRYDLRGYGKSNLGEGIDRERVTQNGDPKDAKNFSHAQDLYLLLRTLGVEGATLIGASLGGATAIDFALEQPTMTNGLVLVGAVPSGYEYTGEMPPALQQFVESCQRGEMERATELATQLWFDGPQRQPAQMDADLRAQVKSMIGDVFRSSMVDFTGENAAAKPAIQRLSEIDAPTLVIFGDQDEANVQRAANLLANEIPAAERVEMSGAAHLPNLEKPDEFYQTVLDFLERIATLDQEGDLATGLGGAVKRKLVAPESVDR
ncbi:MAG: alpha/beta hydrolase [Caldilineaceae bacterium]|nr:alpha/beta hydrolase [Caldilineaceae bacterium]